VIHGARRDLVVLDPFLGIGSSALASLECGVENFIGFDLEEEYVRIAGPLSTTPLHRCSALGLFELPSPEP
jgi:hypothetical protein